MKKFFPMVIATAALAVLMLGCGTAATPGSHEQSIKGNATQSQQTRADKAGLNSKCTLFELEAYVSEAICTGDPKSIDEALQKLFSVPNVASDENTAIEQLHRRFNAIEKVWKSDPAAGQNLPWPQLQRDVVRATLAIYLAPVAFGVGDRIMIVQMRREAQLFGNKDLANNGTLGIRAVGATNVPLMERWLYEIVTSTKSTRYQKISAYTALGSYCTAEALRLLQASRTDRAFPADLRYLFDVVSRLQEGIKSACARKAKFGLIE